MHVFALRLSIRASIVNLVRLWSLIGQKVSCNGLELEWTFFESWGLFNTFYPLPWKLLTQFPHRNGQVWVLSPYPWTQEYSTDQHCQRSDPHQKYNFPRRGSGLDIKWNELHTKEAILSTQPTLVPWQPQVSQSKFSLFIMDDMAWEHIYYEDVQGHVDENGVSNIEEFFKNKLECWRDVEVNIAISGNSGAGKSSFINAIRE